MSTAGGPHDRRARVRAGALLAVGLLVGTGLGAAVGTGVTRSDRPPAVEPGTGAPAGPGTADAACVAAAERARVVVDLAEDAAEAMADLDARRLEEVVRDMRAEDAEVRAAIAACRAPATPERGASTGASPPQPAP
ncbi:hypothetical protein [Aquipuribacter nitratireducens]|uniref:Uncharacterized protein n=1 Tax=Aquipuribacter nitratireducens TaxID=650104 RepID=A0ABW0GN19_9MICO